MRQNHQFHHHLPTFDPVNTAIVPGSNDATRQVPRHHRFTVDLKNHVPGPHARLRGRRAGINLLDYRKFAAPEIGWQRRQKQNHQRDIGANKIEQRTGSNGQQLPPQRARRAIVTVQRYISADRQPAQSHREIGPQPASPDHRRQSQANLPHPDPQHARHHEMAGFVDHHRRKDRRQKQTQQQHEP